MSLKELIRRYAVFTISIFVIGLGLSAVVKTHLGTSPISSTPYVFSVNTPLSIGTYLFIIGLIFILVQMAMLGKKGVVEKKVMLLSQIPISFIFGLCTDFAMWLLTNLAPDTYVTQMVTLIAGCFILALGISLEVSADVLMMGGEYTVQVAAQRFNKEFGAVKMIFDFSLVTLAIVSSLIFTSTVVGIREGTLIAALITGPFVKFIMPRLEFIRKWLSVNSIDLGGDAVPASQSILITIAREYGSGGHDIGEMLAKRLGIPFYDHNLVEMIAKEGAFSEDFVVNNEQNINNLPIYQMIMHDYEAPLEKSLSNEDRLFVAQSKVIKRIAEQGSCVIVGRCSNFILDRYVNKIDIFLHASLEYKIERVISKYGIAPDKASAEIKRVDKARKEHYNFYTGKRWGDARSYQLSCDSSIVSAEDICQSVENIYHTKLAQS